MASALYTVGHYENLRPSWHLEDSAWKATHALSLLRKNRIDPELICEIGCGSGQVLVEMQKALPSHCRFIGLEVSPQAFAACLNRVNDRLGFVMGDSDSHAVGHCDLVLALDIVEHVDDYFRFLRSLRERASYCIVHMPLDLSVQALIRGLPQTLRKTAGHLHYFTRPLFLDVMEECGFDVIDWRYTGTTTERPARSLRTALAKLPRQLFFKMHPDAAALILGGFSLMVLAKPKKH
ncbi:class I SAM-dependent methyltransferase [Silvibacterium acidisoli]|uniref:class I SAM-dependent methyltransferase n=1 Tax=Acidobacteriaceae bacterium ZG23-2 TaxID=2883246 RepID=UPI00406C8D62